MSSKRKRDSSPPSKSAKKAKADDKKQEPSSTFENLYSGYTVPESGKIETVPITDLTPEEFFAKYVSERKPVILTGRLPDEEWTADTKWTNAYLKEKSGEIPVQVEKRKSAADGFGKGNRISVGFGEFLDGLNSDESHYLTTQTGEDDEDGRPPLLPEFLVPLSDDFPLRPKIVGNLVPASLNTWFGNSQKWTTSGLHHDFHDNLYIPLRGGKKFTVFSPRDAEFLALSGSISRVHKNGLINYVGAESNSDGTWEGVEKEVEEKEKMKARVAEMKAAEEASERGEEGAEERMERALMGLMGDLSQDDDEEEGEGDDEEEGEGKAKGKGEAKGKSKGKDDAKGDQEGDPNHFSKIDLTKPRAEILKEFPGFKNAKPMQFEIKSGQILYLPAGWFHNVESQTSSTATSTTSTTATMTGTAREGGHLAFNYWFHPPDTSSFKDPYSSKFWPLDFEERIMDVDIIDDDIMMLGEGGDDEDREEEGGDNGDDEN